MQLFLRWMSPLLAAPALYWLSRESSPGEVWILLAAFAVMMEYTWLRGRRRTAAVIATWALAVSVAMVQGWWNAEQLQLSLAMSVVSQADTFRRAPATRLARVASLLAGIVLLGIGGALVVWAMLLYWGRA